MHRTSDEGNKMRSRTEINKQSNVANNACFLIYALPTVLLPIHGTSTDQVLKTDNKKLKALSFQQKKVSFKIDSVFRKPSYIIAY
jgi:hypothetical protein